MGIISIKCVITRVSDSRAPGPLEKRAPLLPAEARSRGSYRCRLMRRLMQRYFFLKADPRKFEMAPLEQFLPFIFPFYFSTDPIFSNVPKLVLIVKKQRKKLSTREVFYPFSRLSKGTVERIKFLFLAIARIQNQSDPRGWYKRTWVRSVPWESVGPRWFHCVNVWRESWRDLFSVHFVDMPFFGGGWEGA